MKSMEERVAALEDRLTALENARAYSAVENVRRIEEESGMSIQEIFRTESERGELSFRELALSLGMTAHHLKTAKEKLGLSYPFRRYAKGSTSPNVAKQNKRRAKYILKDGRTLHEACADAGVGYGMAYKRVAYLGMTPDEAISKKHFPRHRKKSSPNHPWRGDWKK